MIPMRICWRHNAIYQEIYNSQIEGGGDFDQPCIEEERRRTDL